MPIVNKCHHCHKYKLRFVICEQLWQLWFVNNHTSYPHLHSRAKLGRRPTQQGQPPAPSGAWVACCQPSQSCGSRMRLFSRGHSLWKDRQESLPPLSQGCSMRGYGHSSSSAPDNECYLLASVPTRAESGLLRKNSATRHRERANSRPETLSSTHYGVDNISRTRLKQHYHPSVYRGAGFSRPLTCCEQSHLVRTWYLSRWN